MSIIFLFLEQVRWVPVLVIMSLIQDISVFVQRVTWQVNLV